MQDRPLAAAGSILAAMAIIGFIDQFVAVIAETSSLWTFHLIRSAMMWALALAWVALMGQRLRVVNWRGVAKRSAFTSSAMIIYFGALGFLPVAEAAAGLFTAPIFVLIFSVMFFGLSVGPARIAAVLLGFAGVIAVLAPDPSTITMLTFVPVAAGAFYAVSAIGTRAWCAEETALAISLGVFTAMAIWGIGGITVIGLVGGGDTFLTRGWVTPSGEVLFWTAVQAVGSLIAVVLLTRGYQLAEASKASVFEYSVLGFSALFGWWVSGDLLSPLGYLGLVAIAVSGAIIALRGRRAGVTP
ncbi:MAG: DMT family transporter [Pseudomonadota bacterium]